MPEDQADDLRREIAELHDRLARCRTERDDALTQQMATADVLQVINNMAGDVAPAFEAIVEKALRLCEAAFGGLLRFDGERFHRAALHNLPPPLAQRNRPLRPVPGMALHRVASGEAVVHIDDIADDPAYRNGYASRVAMVQLGGARTAVWVGLRKENRLVGALVAYRQEVRPFSPRQIGLLQNFAAEAVIAIEIARLIGELRARTDEIAAWNRELEQRVAAQFAELDRVGRLKRFLAPQLAELIVARRDEGILKPHRRDIVVLFCDLRGFTAFAESAEPEEVLDLLHEYHDVLGPVVAAFEATVDHFSGDGIMMFFNDPVPCADPAPRAVQMALAMRAAIIQLQIEWRRRGHAIGFGVGIAQGYATLGEIGFASRRDYTANGAVCNLAARLCAEARDGQILISQRIAAAVESSAVLEPIGNLWLKGLARAVSVHNVVN